MACIGISSSQVSCCFHFECQGPPWVEFSKEKVCWIHLGKCKNIPFPVRLIYQISIVSLNRLGIKWAGEEVSFNSSKCFSALVKIFPCGKFKKFKTNKAVLTIVMGLENILCWNLVKSALDKGDSSVPVYSPLIFLFVTLVCDMFIRLCLMSVDYKEYL